MTAPPQDLQAERAVLAAMLLGPEAIELATRTLKGPEFYRTAHRQIFEAILAVHARGEIADLLTVADEMRSSGTLGMVGGPSYVAGVFEEATTSANVAWHAEIVARKAQHRDLSQMARVLAGELDSHALPEDLQARLRAMADLAQARSQRGPRHISEGFAELFLVGAAPRVPLGLSCLAEHLSVTAGELCVYGARPGCGKTAMLGTIATAAARAGWQVLFLSLEMPEKQIRQRILSCDSGIPLKAVQAGEDGRLPAAAERTIRLPIWIEDRPGEMTLERLCGFVQAFVHMNADRPTVVLLDYLQLVRTKQRIDKRHEYIGHVCRELKLLARAAAVPVIAAAQLSRDAEKHGKKSRPQLSDFRESGDIEQTADQAILIHPEESSTWLNVAKQRMGPKFVTECRFVAECSCFEDFGIAY